MSTKPPIPQATARRWYPALSALVFVILVSFGQFLLYTHIRAAGTKIGFDLSRAILLGAVTGLGTTAILTPLWLYIMYSSLCLRDAFTPASKREFRDLGSCPSCGYSTAGLAQPRCPECGGDTRTEVRHPSVFNSKNTRRYSLLLGVGLTLGVAGSEAHLALDTATFVAEAKASVSARYSRQRWWPVRSCSFVTDGTTVWATD